MEAALKGAHRPEASDGGGSPGAVWGVREVMAKDILPNGPTERRKRRRLCAMRAMERLGLWSEENLIPTLAKRPELRWLADEEGARWDVLAELGRIGRRDAFDEAVGWTVMARPRPEEARTRFTGAGPGTRGKVASRTPPSLPRLSRATRREEGRR
jgi:hypothetical protein